MAAKKPRKRFHRTSRLLLAGLFLSVTIVPAYYTYSSQTSVNEVVIQRDPELAEISFNGFIDSNRVTSRLLFGRYHDGVFQDTEQALGLVNSEGKLENDKFYVLRVVTRTDGQLALQEVVTEIDNPYAGRSKEYLTNFLVSIDACRPCYVLGRLCAPGSYFGTNITMRVQENNNSFIATYQLLSDDDQIMAEVLYNLETRELGKAVFDEAKLYCGQKTVIFLEDIPLEKRTPEGFEWSQGSDPQYINGLEYN